MVVQHPLDPAIASTTSPLSLARALRFGDGDLDAENQPRTPRDGCSGTTPNCLCQRRISMSHQVRLSDEVYERIKSEKRDDETFSEAVDRLTADWTLDDYAEEEPVMDPEKHRELLDEIEKDSVEETSKRLKRQGIDVDE